MYPVAANIGGKRYPINTDFRVGLKCFDVVNDPGICDEERALAVIYLLFGFVPESDYDKFLEKARIFLQCGKETVESGTADMDFTADRHYINASFMSDYGIDLSTAALHWWQFCELIEGLTEKAVLSRVRELRGYDLTEIKDAKTRQKIARAKDAVKLPIRHTREEIEALERFNSLFEEGE